MASHRPNMASHLLHMANNVPHMASSLPNIAGGAAPLQHSACCATAALPKWKSRPAKKMAPPPTTYAIGTRVSARAG
eukprot:5152673-Prymnesium_polylepis.1